MLDLIAEGINSFADVDRCNQGHENKPCSGINEEDPRTASNVKSVVSRITGNYMKHLPSTKAEDGSDQNVSNDDRVRQVSNNSLSGIHCARCGIVNFDFVSLRNELFGMRKQILISHHRPAIATT